MKFYIYFSFETTTEITEVERHITSGYDVTNFDLPITSNMQIIHGGKYATDSS